jgi:hypothetical protein
MAVQRLECRRVVKKSAGGTEGAFADARGAFAD